jgi:hypothetical protein
MACWLGGRCLSVCYTVLGAWSRSESVSCSMLMPAGVQQVPPEAEGEEAPQEVKAAGCGVVSLRSAAPYSLRCASAGFSAGGQLEAKHCPAVLCVRGLEVSVLGTGEAPRDSKPDASPPTIGVASGGFGPVEALEDAGEVFGGNSGTRVPHGRLHQAVLLASGYLDATPRGREPQGVVEQSGQDLGHH